MPKFSIGNIIKYKKQRHLILDIDEEKGFYIVLTLDTGTTRGYYVAPIDVAGRLKA